jgi:hypothetical protein
MPDACNSQRHLIDQIKKLDAVLQIPANTLIEVAAHDIKHNPSDRHRRFCHDAIRFPPWISEQFDSDPDDPYLLTRAQCCATLERFFRQRRRFSWMREAIRITDETFDTPKSQLEKLWLLLPKSFRPESVEADWTGDEAYLRNHWECLSSNEYGNGNPLTASNVFRVLLYSGEAAAHVGVGILALFSMLWSLERRFPVGLVRGARIEPWGPTAYVTAQCLMPIERLLVTCQRRRELYGKLREVIFELKKESSANDVLGHSKFVSLLDQFAVRLSDLSRIALGGDNFKKCAQIVEDAAGELTADQSLSNVWSDIEQQLVETVKDVGKQLVETGTEGVRITKQIESNIVSKLTLGNL